MSIIFNSWIFILIGLLIGLIGILVTIYISKKRKCLFYSIKSFNLLSNTVSSLPSFKASYKNKPIENLTVCKIHLWNSGTDIINNNDIPSSDNIRIEFPESVDILDQRIIATSHRTNQSSITIREEKKNILDIDFDYLTVKQGLVFTLLHTGKTEDKPRVLGTIKGGSSLDSVESESVLKIHKIFDETLPGILVLLTLVISIALLIIIDIRTWLKWIIGIIGVPIIFTLEFAIIQKIEQIYLNRRPGELRSVFDKEFSAEDYL